MRDKIIAVLMGRFEFPCGSETAAIADAIEAAILEGAEPVAIVNDVLLPNFADRMKITCKRLGGPLASGTELYTFPPNAQREIEQLKQQLAVCQKNAERYRWLRDQNDGGESPWYIRGPSGFIPTNLDLAIDAAIASMKGEK